MCVLLLPLAAASSAEAPPPDLIPIAKAAVITATRAGDDAEFGEGVTVKLVSPGLWSVKGGVTARESLGWILTREWEVHVRVRELRPGRLADQGRSPALAAQPRRSGSRGSESGREAATDRRVSRRREGSGRAGPGHLEQLRFRDKEGGCDRMDASNNPMRKGG